MRWGKRVATLGLDGSRASGNQRHRGRDGTTTGVVRGPELASVSGSSRRAISGATSRSNRHHSQSAGPADSPRRRGLDLAGCRSAGADVLPPPPGCCALGDTRGHARPLRVMVCEPKPHRRLFHRGHRRAPASRLAGDRGRLCLQCLAGPARLRPFDCDTAVRASPVRVADRAGDRGRSGQDAP